MQQDNNNSKAAVTKTEHDNIAHFLQKELPDFLESRPLTELNQHHRRWIRQLLKVFPGLHGQTQNEITDKLQQQPENDYKIDRSTLSRWITLKLNSALKKFSEERNISPPIHLFSSYYDSEAQKNQPVGAFLACSYPREGFPNTAKSIVPFAVAKGGGEIERFRKRLKDEAESHLAEKLHYVGIDDYQPLGLELGLIKKSSSNEKDSSYNHNREWSDFECCKLENLQGIYILSSETGSGKTTFLRDLQLAIIKNTKLIPIFMEASSAATLDYRNKNSNNFLEGVAKLFNGYLQSKREYDFLQTHLDKVVFLIDGLDQIIGTGYKNLINKLMDVIDDRLIITLRPFAAIDKEEDSKIKFLRLKPFSEKDTQTYFGKKYKRAKELCRICSEMIRVPMLAYMVRQLIEEGRDEYIKNRAGLYEKFIGGVFEEYIHENLDVSEDMKAKIRNAYGEISFKAIANDTPYLQRIPLSFAIGCKETDIVIDDLFKYGIAHTIVNRSPAIKKSIYFSHQSFQEYLAAECAAKDPKIIHYVLNEKWNPKWKEVIKFLAGILGEDFIKKVYSPRCKDNCIHSRLFLAARLLQETTVNGKMRDKISQKLENLQNDPIFARDAHEHWVYVNDIKIINNLLEGFEFPDHEVYMAVFHSLGKFDYKIKDGDVQKIVSKLDDENDYIVQVAIEILSVINSKIDIDIIKKVSAKLEDDDKSPDFIMAACNFLTTYKDLVDHDDVKKLAYKLEDESEFVVSIVMGTLGDFEDLLDRDIIRKIASKLEDPRVSGLIIDFFRTHKDLVDYEIVKKVAKLIESEHIFIVISALLGLGSSMKNMVNDEIVKKIATKLQDRNAGMIAARALRTLKDFVSREIQEKLLVLLENKKTQDIASIIEDLAMIGCEVDYDIAEDIYIRLENKGSLQSQFDTIITFGESNEIAAREICAIIARMLDDRDDKNIEVMLNILGEMKDGVSYKIVKKIASKLGDNEKEVISAALRALKNLDNRVDFEIAKKIATLLDNNDVGLVKLAIDALAKYKNMIDQPMIKKLIDLNNKESYELLKDVYKEGKLEFLGSG